MSAESGAASTGLWTWHNTMRTQFAGMEKDAGTGLDHTPFRKYESGLGRWTSPDPYPGSMSLSDPQSFNRYAYVSNDPVNLVDPSGLDGNDPSINEVVTVFGTIDDRVSTTGNIWGGLRGGGGGLLGGSGEGAFATDLGFAEGGAGGTVASPQKPTPDNLTSNQDVLNDLYCLWKRGGYGYKDTERSVWITQNGGKYGSVAWPWSAESKKETWKGPIPAGTVANAHTHPNSGGTKPSTTGGNTGRGDQGTADKIGLPVYVVTRNAIWKAVPNGKDPVQVAGQDWFKPSEKAKVKCK